MSDSINEQRCKHGKTADDPHERNGDTCFHPFACFDRCTGPSVVTPPAEQPETLQRRLFNECEQAGWDPEKRNSFAEECAHLHEEVSEAFRAYRLTKNPAEIWTDEDGKPQGVPIELADVLIGLFYNAEMHGFDLLEAVEIKHQWNLRRDYQAEGRALHPLEAKVVADYTDIDGGSWEIRVLTQAELVAWRDGVVGQASQAAKLAGQSWVPLAFLNDNWFTWLCPGCGYFTHGQTGPVAVSGWDEPRWTVEGLPDHLTMMPSLGCPRWRENRCVGHWWVRDGKLVPA